MFAENAEISAMKIMTFMSVPTAGMPAISRTAAKAFCLHRLAVPRQQRNQQDDGADVEHEDAGDDRADRAGHGGAGILGLGRRDRHDLQAAERRNDGQERDRDARQAIGHKPVVPQDVLPHALVAGQGADNRRTRDQVHAHAQEGNNRDDLHHRQPGLDLTILTGGQQVNAANNNDNNEGHHPLRDLREPADEERRRARHLQARHHDEHDPIQPPDREACPAADPGLGVRRKRTRRRQGRGQLREGQHDRHDDKRGHRVGHDDGGSGLVDRGTRAQEEAGANREAQGHHGQVPRLKTLTPRGGLRLGGRRRKGC